MKPTECRDATFEKIRSCFLAEVRWDVYQAFLHHGPATTRVMAEKARIDLLTLRPRVTELCQAGFLVEVDEQDSTNAREGVYQARTVAEFELWRAEMKEAATSGQQQLI